jgi:hypothetical protein
MFPMRNLFDKSLTRLAVLASSGIAGCALLPAGHYGPGSLAPGATESAVLAQMGEPTERRRGAADGPLGPTAQTLVYARGPMGQHTFMMELDAQGRLLRWFNALEPARLAQVQPGMAQAEVRQRLGPPAHTQGLAFEGRSLWAWRFPTYDCLWFAVSFSAQGRVLDAGQMTDPRCDVDRD